VNQHVQPQAESAFIQVPPEMVPQVWPLIVEGLHTAVDRASGRITISSIAKFLVEGKWQLWLFLREGEYKALAVTQIVTNPSGLKSLDGIICTGDDKELWERIMPETLEAFARMEGCQLFEMWARPGWERILGSQGFRKTHVMLEKDLTK
jgi:hypothetical protein